jgi:hypothetical protein
MLDAIVSQYMELVLAFRDLLLLLEELKGLPRPCKIFVASRLLATIIKMFFFFFLKQFHSPKQINNNLTLFIIYFNTIYSYFWLCFSRFHWSVLVAPLTKEEMYAFTYRYIIIINSNDTFINCFIFIFWFIIFILNENWHLFIFFL